jgi:hypothetical protein
MIIHQNGEKGVSQHYQVSILMGRAGGAAEGGPTRA